MYEQISTAAFELPKRTAIFVRSKKTDFKYVKMAEADPLGLDKLLEMDDPVLEWHLTGGNPKTVPECYRSWA